MLRVLSWWRFSGLYYGWVIVAAAFLEHIISVGTFNSQGVFLKPILSDFGWSRGTVAGAFALANVVAGLSAPFTGMLLDKYGPRVLLAGGGLLVAAGYLLTAQATTLLQFYIFVVLFQGIGRSSVSSGVIPVIPRWFEGKRGLTQGIVQAGGGLGTMLVPPVATYMVLSFGWQDAYLVLALGIALGYLALSRIFRRGPEEMGLRRQGSDEAPPNVSRRPAGRHAGQGTTGFTLRQAFRTRALWQFVVIGAVVSFSQLLVMTHLVAHATDKGLSPVVAATFVSVIGLSNAVGKLVMGFVSDRIGRRASMIVSFSLAGAMLLWLMAARDAWAFYAFAAVFGFAYGSWMPMFPSLTADLFGVASLGAIYGIVRASTNLGGALGSYAGGYIFDLTHSYSYAFLSGTVLLGVGIVLMLTLKPPPPARQP
ncbi:MAG: MFS transporter [Chloroflexi bacterium]|nr:MFS transporter [Chloroflexota bacterium]